MNAAFWFGIGASAVVILELGGIVLGLWLMPGPEEGLGDVADRQGDGS